MLHDDEVTLNMKSSFNVTGGSKQLLLGFLLAWTLAIKKCLQLMHFASLFIVHLTATRW